MTDFAFPKSFRILATEGGGLSVFSWGFNYLSSPFIFSFKSEISETDWSWSYTSHCLTGSSSLCLIFDSSSLFWLINFLLSSTSFAQRSFKLLISYFKAVFSSVTPLIFSSKFVFSPVTLLIFSTKFLFSSKLLSRFCNAWLFNEIFIVFYSSFLFNWISMLECCSLRELF